VTNPNMIEVKRENLFICGQLAARAVDRP